MVDAHENFAYSTVATAPVPPDSGASLTVAAGDGVLFPATPFNATVWPASVMPLATNAEIVRVTDVTGDVLTITRAQESTTAKNIAIGWQIANTITKKVLKDIEDMGHDAADVTYTPAVAADWNGDADPGNVDDALDQLAERVDDLEGESGHDAVTLAASADALLGLTGQELSLDTQEANKVLAGPASGADAAPTFRTLVMADLPAVDKVVSINVGFDDGGAELADQTKRLYIDFACAITGITLLADAAGNATVDIKTSSYADYPTTASICGGSPPTLSGAQKAQPSIAGWTTAIAAGTVIEFALSAATVAQLTVSLAVTRS